MMIVERVLSMGIGLYIAGFLLQLENDVKAVCATRGWRELLLPAILVLEGITYAVCRRVIGWEYGCLLLFFCLLLVACIEDVITQLIPRYLWLLQLGALGGYQWVNRIALTGMIYMELAVFCLIQEILFARLYGRADAHCLCVCAYFLCLRGGGFREAVYHLATSFLLLLLAQFLQGNIGGRGKLKHPVPMLPYILAGLLLCLDF